MGDETGLKKIVGHLKSRARLLVILCLIQLPFGILFSNVWWIEITTHFLPQQILLFIISLAVWRMPMNRKAGIAVFIGGVTLVLVSLALPDFWGASSMRRVLEGGAQERPDLQIIGFNVLGPNPEKDRVAQWILSTLSKEVPNIVVLLEANASWVQGLDPLKKVLPHKYLRLRTDDNFGIAVFSSVPFDNAEFESLEGECGVPQFTGRVPLRKGSIKVLGIHTLPPNMDLESRNRCLKVIEGALVSKDTEQEPAVAVGDFNCSPWSPWFPRKLNDPFPFLMRRHTWSILGGLVSTAIDHAVYTGPLEVLSAEVGPELNSDHRPLKVVLRVNK